MAENKTILNVKFEVDQEKLQSLEGTMEDYHRASQEFWQAMINVKDAMSDFAFKFNATPSTPGVETPKLEDHSVSEYNNLLAGVNKALVGMELLNGRSLDLKDVSAIINRLHNEGILFKGSPINGTD